MNLSINNLQSKYGCKLLINNKNETYVRFNPELDNKKVNEEQDKLDYELYKNSIMIHTAFTYDQFKNNTSMFPPCNASGIVRKTWRELAEKATTEKEKLFLLLGRGY